MQKNYTMAKAVATNGVVSIGGIAYAIIGDKAVGFNGEDRFVCDAKAVLDYINDMEG